MQHPDNIVVCWKQSKNQAYSLPNETVYRISMLAGIMKVDLQNVYSLPTVIQCVKYFLNLQALFKRLDGDFFLSWTIGLCSQYSSKERSIDFMLRLLKI